MNYPFEFNELLLTEKALDWLGFTGYWDLNGDTGDRRLDLGGDGRKYLLWEGSDRMEDGDGYASPPKYCVTSHFFKEEFNGELYFLHELYEDIKLKRTDGELSVFEEKCRDANMMPYLESYLKWKETNYNSI